MKQLNLDKIFSQFEPLEEKVKVNSVEISLTNYKTLIYIVKKIIEKHKKNLELSTEIEKLYVLVLKLDLNNFEKFINVLDLNYVLILEISFNLAIDYYTELEEYERCIILNKFLEKIIYKNS